MSDDWIPVGTVTDGSGKRLVIARSGPLVRIAVMAPVAGMHALATIDLDGEARDQFIRAFAAAETAAEAVSG